MKAWMVAWAAVLLCAAGETAQAQESGTADTESAERDLQGTRAAIGKWVGTQQIIFKERRDWQQAREILRARIDLVKKETATVEEKLAGVRRTGDEAAGRRAEALAETDAVKRTSDGLMDAVAQYESHVRRLHSPLPAHLQEKLAPLYQRIPDPGAAPGKASAAERFQNVLGILNEINRANGEITLASEIRTLGDGRPSEVKTVYLGLAQAYYLSARGEAGIGRPTAEGWVWEPAPDLAPRVTEVVEILQNKRSPQFVALPVQIQ